MSASDWRANNRRTAFDQQHVFKPYMSSSPLSLLLPHLLPRLWVFALRLSGDQDEAENLVLKSCARALRQELSAGSEDSVLEWMFSIIHSIWILELGSPANRDRAINQGPANSRSLRPTQSCATSDEGAWYQKIIGAVEALPESLRLVMLITEIEGLSILKTAELLAIPIDTMMSRLLRAREIIGSTFRSNNSRFSVSKKPMALGRR